jgi:hypothetical protein
MSGAAPFFWRTPLKYCRWAARERPALFWSVIIGAAGPVAMPIVPPIRYYFGDVDAPPVPVTYPSAFTFRLGRVSGYTSKLTFQRSSHWSQETAHRLRRLRSRIGGRRRKFHGSERKGDKASTQYCTNYGVTRDSATTEGEEYHRGIQGTRADVQNSPAIDAPIRFSTSNQSSRPPIITFSRHVYVYIRRAPSCASQRFSNMRLTSNRKRH